MKRLMKTKVSIPLILILIGIGIGITFYTAYSTISYAGSNAYCIIYGDEEWEDEDDKTGLAVGEVGWQNIRSGDWYAYARLDRNSRSNSGSTRGNGNQVVAIGDDPDNPVNADVASANSSVNSVGEDGITYRNSASDDDSRDPD